MEWVPCYRSYWSPWCGDGSLSRDLSVLCWLWGAGSGGDGVNNPISIHNNPMKGEIQVVLYVYVLFFAWERRGSTEIIHNPTREESSFLCVCALCFVGESTVPTQGAKRWQWAVLNLPIILIMTPVLNMFLGCMKLMEDYWSSSISISLPRKVKDRGGVNNPIPIDNNQQLTQCGWHNDVCYVRGITEHVKGGLYG